jgi:hypothetical protein
MERWRPRPSQRAQTDAGADLWAGDERVASRKCESASPGYGLYSIEGRKQNVFSKKRCEQPQRAHSKTHADKGDGRPHCTRHAGRCTKRSRCRTHAKAFATCGPGDYKQGRRRTGARRTGRRCPTRRRLKPAATGSHVPIGHRHEANRKAPPRAGWGSSRHPFARHRFAATTTERAHPHRGAGLKRRFKRSRLPPASAGRCRSRLPKLQQRPPRITRGTPRGRLAPQALLE